MSVTVRTFPIQRDRYHPRSQNVRGPSAIEWDRAAFAYESYHRLYPQQSLDQLAERGGFGWVEYLAHSAGTRVMRSIPHAASRTIHEAIDSTLAGDVW